jgi:hypothetical protein
VDGLVSELILGALAPSAIEVSLQVAEDLELERIERSRHWAQRLERAHYETALARRRYEAVDPQNRLVARTLERDWEAALAAEQALRAEHERELARQPARLQPMERAAIRSVAEDVPALWHAPTTTPADRQAIARVILDRVTVRVEGHSQHVEVSCVWIGGKQTHHRLVRTVRHFEQLREFDKLLEYIRQLRGQGCAASVIAERLNAEGWRPPKRATFNESTVLRLLSRCGLSAERPIWTSRVSRQAGTEWTLQEVSARAGVHQCTVYRWLRQGRLRARMATRGDQRIWLVQMTEAELDQIKANGGPPKALAAQRKPS